jgi:hypothetical protein
VFNQLDHALMLRWMRSPTEGSHSSAVALGTARVVPSPLGGFAPTGQYVGCEQAVAWVMRYISPLMRMMACACRALPERFDSVSQQRCVRRHSLPISPRHTVN